MNVAGILSDLVMFNMIKVLRKAWDSILLNMLYITCH